MKYTTNSHNAVPDGDIVRIRIELPEMANAPVVVVTLPAKYTPEELTSACETRLTELKQIIASEDTRDVTFSDGFTTH